MPYEKSEAKLETLVKQALDDPNDPELRNGVDQADIDRSDLYRAIKKDATEIWAGVSAETWSYDSLETRIQSEEQRAASSLPPEPGPAKIADGEKPEWPILTFSVTFVLTFIFIVVLVVIRGFSGASHFLWGTKPGFVLLILSGVLLVGALTYSLVLDRLARIRFERSRAALERALEQWRNQKDAAEKDAGIPMLRTQLTELSTEIEKSLLEKKIKPKMRDVINAGLLPSYDLNFAVIGARGLAEVFDPSQAIDTTARQRLRFMLENTAGGSIGIAGPRGAGKSTLILSYCGPKPTIDTLKGLPVLSVLASAPVEYQARDFILYLFSAVCHRVLSLHGISFDQGELQEPEHSGEGLVVTVLRLVGPFSRIMLYVGWLLLILSLLLATLLAKYPQPAESRAANQPAATQPAVQSAPGSQNPQPATMPAPVETAVPLPVRLLRALGIEPGFLFTFGIGLLVIGVAVRLLLNARGLKVEQLDFYFNENLTPSIGFKNIATSLVSDRPVTTQEQQEEGAKRQALIEESQKWLRKIKFQQSYTSGWSGALKLPVGLEGGVNSAVTLAENQLSLPEIVHNFTLFISKLSAHYQVIIGIDELDKLESDDKAQRFLNEIKSIFGLERCFYLISVSENAMSNFERRGLPFRDVFDSSFDSVIYVDYLSFTGAKNLLSERVTGKPIPFFGLSYCLAGGLPRDLIRHFRHMLELSQRAAQIGQPGANALEPLCNELVKADLKAKIRALAVAAKRLELEPEASAFLEAAYSLDSEPLTGTGLLQSVPRLLSPLAPLPANGDVDRELLDKRHRLTAMKKELGVYSQYLATLLQFFNDSLKQQILQAAEQEGAGLDQLARARQILAVDPDITMSLLNIFRAKYNLVTPVPPPHPPAAVLPSAVAPAVAPSQPISAPAMTPSPSTPSINKP